MAAQCQLQGTPEQASAPQRTRHTHTRRLCVTQHTTTHLSEGARSVGIRASLGVAARRGAVVCALKAQHVQAVGRRKLAVVASRACLGVFVTLRVDALQLRVAGVYLAVQVAGSSVRLSE